MNTPPLPKLQDFLPGSIIDRIRDQYAMGIAKSEARYHMHSADEDAITGALGQSIAENGEFYTTHGGNAYEVAITYEKVRGRGPGAPEKIFGTDGIFQLEVKDAEGNVLFTKGLPFQSKVEWNGKSTALNRQAQKMEDTLGGGVVIDFSPDGYKACTTRDAIRASGNRRLLDETNKVTSLQDTICNDFMDCNVGRRGLHFDRDSETFLYNMLTTNQNMHVISTTVTIED